MNPAKELLQEAIDRIGNLSQELSVSNVMEMKSLLPEIVKDLKAGFVGVTGENPWG